MLTDDYPDNIENNNDSTDPVEIHISKDDIFYADPDAISLRRLLGVIYSLCGIGMVFYTTGYLPYQTGGPCTILYFTLGFLLILLGLGFFIAAWHKHSYRCFVNEQGVGACYTSKIPTHSWNEVEYVLQRLYYWGTPPTNGVWGFAPRRLDEDYVVVLKTGERLVFGRRNLGHLSRFKPLLLYYSEQNDIVWRTQDIYHSRRLKAGKKLIPRIIALSLISIPIVLVGSQFLLVHYIQNHAIVLSETGKKALQEDRFSWPIEILPRKAQQINQCNNPGSTQPLNIRLASMYINADGTVVAMGTDFGAFLLRDIETNTEIGSLPNAQLSAVVFTMVSQDKTRAITRDFDTQFQVWDLETKKELFALEVPNKYYHSAVFSADGNFIYFGDLEGRVSVYDIRSGNVVKKLAGLQKSVSYILAPKEGRKIVAGYENNAVYIWDLFMEGDPVILNLDSPLVSAQFTTDNKDLATLEQNGTFKIWNYSVHQDTFSRPIISRNPDERFEQFSISHNGKIVAFGSNQGTISIYSITKSREIEKLIIPGMESPTPVLSIAFTIDDKYVVVGTKYGVWKIQLDKTE